MAELALVLAALGLLVSGATALLVLAGLRPDQHGYAELAARVDEQDKLLSLCGEANKQLFRYIEGLDDVTGGRGHQVLLSVVPGGSPGADQRGGH